jgi:hypothetical protein
MARDRSQKAQVKLVSTDVKGCSMEKGESEFRETLHDFSIDYVRSLADVFGWRVREAKGSQKGPDLIIENVIDGKVESVMFVESEVGHDQGGAPEYFDKLFKRIKPYFDEYVKGGVRVFSFVVITNAPRRLREYFRKHKHELSGKINFQLIEGLTLFIVPTILVVEVMPTIFVRAMGAISILASSTSKTKSLFNR